MGPDESPLAPLFRLLRGAALVLVLSPFVCCLGFSLEGLVRGQTTWERLEAVQVLGGREELWVVAEVSTRVTHASVLASGGPRAVSRRQVVAAVTTSGVVTRYEANLSPLIVHPNVSRAVYTEGSFFQVDPWRADCAFVWTGASFRPATAAKARKVVVSQPPDKVREELDRLTKAEGGELLAAFDDPHELGTAGEMTLLWGSLPCRMRLAQGAGGRSLWVQVAGGQDVAVITFDPTRRPVR